VTDYYLSRWASTMVNTDEVFYGFIRECAAAGSACALTKDLNLEKLSKKALEKEVLAKIADLFDELAARPISASRAKHPGLLTWSQLKGTIFQGLYAPTAWNDLAKDLQALIDGDPVPFFEKHGLAPCENVPPTKPQSDEAMLAIACGDVAHIFKKKPTIKELTKLVEEEERLSKYFGGSFSETAACRGEWKLHSNEPYTGDFTSKTKHGLLIIGNSYDPVTPHVNAEYMSSLFPNSAYLLRKGYGHCSISQKSKCIEETVGAYFLEGTLPKNGTVCDVDLKDEPLFTEGDKAQSATELDMATLLNDHGAAGRFLMAGMEDLAAINSRPHWAS
jgi:TAP-like protein